MRQVLTIWMMLMSTSAFAEPPRKTTDSSWDIHAANKKLGRGMNIGNCLEAPREGAWGVRLRAAYFTAIKEAGFATIRLPVNWSAHAQREVPYTLDAAFAGRVDWAIDQALANQLNIIINVHHYTEMDATPDQHLPRLLALWEQLAARYQDRPASVVFELLNEPHDKLTAAKWNAAIPRLLAVIRKTNPTRPVLVGPCEWNAIRALDSLDLPADPNLIVTVHFYDPFHFTHQGAAWVKDSKKWQGQKWTATEAERAAIRTSLGQASTWAKKHDRPIFLGEFGAYEAADVESRARWTRFVCRQAEAFGFSWAYWEFCAGFGAYDPKADTWRTALKAGLIE